MRAGRGEGRGGDMRAGRVRGGEEGGKREERGEELICSCVSRVPRNPSPSSFFSCTKVVSKPGNEVICLCIKDHRPTLIL